MSLAKSGTGKSSSLKSDSLIHLILPSFSNCFESVLNKGELLQVAGTNVVRVPFGVRQPKRQRPAKLSTWATLVLPLQSFDSPSPPPHAA